MYVHMGYMYFGGHWIGIIYVGNMDVIAAIEFSERLSYFGIAANMITYMTTVMHQDLKTAANSVNIWTGVTTVTVSYTHLTLPTNREV